MNNLLTSTNAEYHQDREFLSSSQLKLLLEDPAKFYHEVVLNNRVDDNKPAYEVGTLLHTLILEPHLIGNTVVYPGMQRRGKEYEKFAAANAGRKIVTAGQMTQAERMFKAHCALPAAVSLIQGGFSEHTMTAEIQGIKVKCRADYINIDQGYMVDVKSTNMPSDVEIFRNTVREYSYDLSAALYCQIAEAVYGKPFTFYWDAVSKTDDMANVYRMSTQTRTLGAEKVSTALLLYKQCKASGVWQLEQKNKPQVVLTEYEVLDV